MNALLAYRAGAPIGPGMLASQRLHTTRTPEFQEALLCQRTNKVLLVECPAGDHVAAHLQSASVINRCRRRRVITGVHARRPLADQLRKSAAAIKEMPIDIRKEQFDASWAQLDYSYLAVVRRYQFDIRPTQGPGRPCDQGSPTRGGG
jgi:hypothetical protein